MESIQLPELTYRLLKERAAEAALTPEQLADEVLRRELSPAHPHIEVVTMAGGPTAVVKGTRIPVSILIGYVKMGETPQDIVTKALPGLTLAQVYDALSYYYDHQAELDRERAENTEAASQARLRESVGDENYQRMVGLRV